MTKILMNSINVAEFIADKLATLDKTQRQVAEECGFDNSNVITLLKQGLINSPSTVSAFGYRRHLGLSRRRCVGF